MHVTAGAYTTPQIHIHTKPSHRSICPFFCWSCWDAPPMPYPFTFTAARLQTPLLSQPSLILHLCMQSHNYGSISFSFFEGHGSLIWTLPSMWEQFCTAHRKYICGCFSLQLDTHCLLLRLEKSNLIACWGIYSVCQEALQLDTVM